MWRAGALYFAIVFAIAFVFGTVRTFALEPRLGETAAVAIEAPFLVAVMFFAARLITARANLRARGLIGVGLLALLLQQIAELGLVAASGETFVDYLRHFATLPGMIFFAALVTFALMPLAVGRRRR